MALALSLIPVPGMLLNTWGLALGGSATPPVVPPPGWVTHSSHAMKPRGIWVGDVSAESRETASKKHHEQLLGVIAETNSSGSEGHRKCLVDRLIGIAQRWLHCQRICTFLTFLFPSGNKNWYSVISGGCFHILTRAGKAQERNNNCCFFSNWAELCPCLSRNGSVCTSMCVCTDVCLWGCRWAWWASAAQTRYLAIFSMPQGNPSRHGTAQSHTGPTDAGGHKGSEKDPGHPQWH